MEDTEAGNEANYRWRCSGAMNGSGHVAPSTGQCGQGKCHEERGQLMSRRRKKEVEKEEGNREEGCRTLLEYGED